MLKRLAIVAAIALTATLGACDGADTTWRAERVMSMDSLVNIVLLREGNYRGHGSGVAIGERLVLTNAHVAQADHTIQITGSDGIVRTGQVVWRAEKADLAVVFVKRSLPATSTIACRRPPLGERVQAAGFPSAGMRVVFRGWVASNLPPYIRNEYVAEKRDPNRYLVVDVRVTGGNSGGPLVDAQGKVVGIITARMGGNVALAVPGSVICDNLKQAGLL